MSTIGALAALGALLVGLGLVLAAGRFRPGLLESRSSLPLGLLAAGSAAGAAAAGDAPTGHPPLDLVLRAGGGAGLTLAASRARRWSLVTAAAIAAVGSAGKEVAPFAWFALGAVLGAVVAHRRGRLLGALVGAALAQALLRLGFPSPTGATAALAGAAALAVSVSALRQARRRTRRAVVWTAGALAAVGLAAAGLTLLAALRARGVAEAGLAAAQAGLDAARAGDRAAAVADLAAAHRDFSAARARLSATFARPGHGLPVVAQNAHALGALASAGVETTGPVLELLAAARSPALRLAGGGVDLPALEALGRKVRASVSALAQATAVVDSLHSPWLVPPVARRLPGLEHRLAATLREGRTLEQATEVLPGLLGAHGPRRYALIVQDPVESRGSGGFIGDEGVLEADRGHLRLRGFGPVPAAVDHGYVNLTGKAAAWADADRVSPALYPGDASFSPDFPTTAGVVEQVWPELGTGRLDGVVSVDPIALGDLLGATGPVVVPAWPVPVTSADAAAILLHDQYQALAGPRRQQFLDELTRTVFERLTGPRGPSPEGLARALAPAVAGKHLLLFSNDRRAEQLFEDIGAAGAMAPVRGDFLEVVTQNASEDKADWYLRRRIVDRVRLDPATGAERATVELTLANSAPTTGPVAVVGGPGTPVAAGVNLQFVSVYTGLGLAGATLDGRVLDMGSAIEDGRHMYSAFVRVPPGGAVTLVVRLSGRVAHPRRYHLELAEQPRIFPDEVAVEVAPTRGWRVLDAPARGPAPTRGRRRPLAGVSAAGSPAFAPAASASARTGSASNPNRLTASAPPRGVVGYSGPLSRDLSLLVRFGRDPG